MSRARVRVTNMQSRNGNPVPNQFIIHEPDGSVVFQSYDTVIAVVGFHGRTTLDAGCLDYSRTTSRYLAEFLGETTKEIKRKILEGKYTLEDLNKEG